MLTAALVFPSIAALAGEADDLQRAIDVARQGAKDLANLDELKAAREDLALLDVWLRSAWTLRSEEKYNEVRVVLDRCQAQADMIRETIVASKISLEAAQKEGELKALRDEIARTKQAINAAMAKKASLEGKGRS